MPANRYIPLVLRQPIGEAYCLLTFRHAEVAHEARGGQFVMLKAGLSAEPPVRRPFSIMAVDPAAETFTIYMKTIGQQTRALALLSAGEIAQCVGPLGQPFRAPQPDVEALLIAGGYGIAPFHLFAQQLLREGRRARVFFGGRSAADIALTAPFAQLSVPLCIATEDGSAGFHGRVTQAVEAHLAKAQSPVALYACGPEGMLHAVAHLAEERRLPAQVSLDPWMGCGLGVCLACVVRIQTADDERPRYRCACKDGPIFDAREIVWRNAQSSAAAAERSRT
ncbi:MAG: dihydroorotate dehydrogenase electron transfer subunit [Vicinamibacteria bacterium]|jgi:dihydroorotate dehydrogenase electron transfer subunit|nr:dihydroorotate dehydrogenase electron transfer subunit [Vicinamibacteria bacterium]